MASEWPTVCDLVSSEDDTKIDLSLEKGTLEVLIVDEETGALRLQREHMQCGGTVVLPDPDDKHGSLYWLRPVQSPDEEKHSEGNENDR